MRTLAYAAVLALAFSASSGLAQTAQKMSDDELVKLALSAAPDAVSKDAAVMRVEADGKMPQGQRTVDLHARSRRSEQPRPNVRRQERYGMGACLDDAQAATRQQGRLHVHVAR